MGCYVCPLGSPESPCPLFTVKLHFERHLAEAHGVLGTANRLPYLTA